MTKVDFYLLSGVGPAVRETMACKLVDKVYRMKHNIYIHTDSETNAQQLDNVLWTFKPGSFIPHSICKPGIPCKEPVIIGYQDQPPEYHDVLVNLSDDVPLFFSQFNRVAEFVDADENARTMARTRFKFYKDRGYELKTHELSVN